MPVKNLEKKQSAAKINKTNTHSLTPLVQLTKNGEFLREWNGAVCASMELSGKKDNHIHTVCNGDRNYTLGYRWLWKEDYDVAIKEGIPILEYIAKKQAMFEFSKKTIKRPMFTVIQCTYSGEYVATYKSMKDANLSMGASRKGGVNRAFSEKKNIKYAYGYLWFNQEEYDELMAMNLDKEQLKEYLFKKYLAGSTGKEHYELPIN